MKRKIMACLMALTLALSLLPVTAGAEDENTFEVDGIYYSITGEDTVEVVAGVDLNHQDSPYRGEIKIPDRVNKDDKSYQVTAIAVSAFAMSSATKVEIPNTVTTISAHAFDKSSSLEVVSFPSGSGLTTIGDNAFDSCTSLSEFTIPSTVTSIGENAFINCLDLEELTIPAGVAEGLFDALWGYNNTILFAENSPYDIEDGVLYKNRTTVEGWLDRSITEIEIRDGVTEIPTSFGTYNTVTSRITSITLPDSVVKIGDYAFMQQEVTSIDLSHVTEIGTLAFFGNTELETIEWPDNMESLGQNAFANCSALKNVEINGSIEEIPSSAFAGCSALETVVISESVESIGASAFSGISGDASDTTFIMKGTTPPTFDNSAFGSSKPTNLTVIVPAGSEAAYAGDGVIGDYITTGESGSETKPGITFELSLTDASITVGGTTTFTATVPEGATLTASSSNSAATAAVNGSTITVTGVAAGSATVTASITLGGVSIATETCTVTVTDPGHHPLRRE